MTAQPEESVTALVAKADAAEEAMYEARPRAAKDHKDDALGLLERAAAMADRMGMEEEALRLRTRRDNLIAVWDRQFRGAGY